MSIADLTYMHFVFCSYYIIINAYNFLYTVYVNSGPLPLKPVRIRVSVDSPHPLGPCVS
jgi:hypothetical protein